VDFNRLYLPGAVPMLAALLFALTCLWGYVELARGDESARPFARRSYRFFALAITFASVVLALALLRRDYRLEYVEQYSGNDLATHFQFAAFWAGQKGSFLIWLLWGALLGLPLIHSAGKRLEAPVMGIYTLTQLGILFILIRESPFLLLDRTPIDGAGLNPLLQDNWMVIHPPIMFVGYALSAMPFAFALSALWRRDFDGWATRAFPWALAAFLVIGTAILLGGYWAYKTLGWGGYWGWDPVENASLIPWLLSTVLIHGLYLERTKQRFRRINLVLACLIYLSVLYGTFLTRSGVLADFSVHSFVDLGISGWLVALMAFFGLSSVLLLATRLRYVPTQPSEDPFLSRGSFLTLATITLMVSTIAVTVGTSAPLLTRFMPNPGQVGPSFYNRVNMPLALLMCGLLALVPSLTWKGEALSAILPKLRWPALFALVATAIAAVAAVHSPFHLAFVFLASLAFGANLLKTVELARNQAWKRAGGYLAHVGVGTILLGVIASSVYDQSAKITLTQGKPAQVGDLTLTFEQFLPRTATERERMQIAVTREDGLSYTATPRFFVNDRTRQLMVNPHIRNLLLEDLYISPIEFDPGAAAGDALRFALTKGESRDLGVARLTFQGFDLTIEGGAVAAMETGAPVAVGAVLQWEQGETSRQLAAVYRFYPDGRVESPPLALPGGAQLAVTGIDASRGAVQLAVAGLDDDAAAPAKLSVDVTRKPLIKMVWYGLYVVLAGGLVAMVHRQRDANRLEDRETVAPGSPEPPAATTAPAAPEAEPPAAQA
jgi:cytochrome c-type biogenesis protein CcmF